MIKLNSLLALFALTFPVSAQAVTIISDLPEANFTTLKVAYFTGDVNPQLKAEFTKQMKATENIPGPRVVVINSGGGYIKDGDPIVDMIHLEQSEGVKVYCVVVNNAHSMAFNFLTNCDVRLANPRATMVVHKLRYETPPYPLTAKNMRDAADAIDVDDEPYRQANHKAMGLTLAEYDRLCDAETRWSAKTMRRIGYLHGFAILKK